MKLEVQRRYPNHRVFWVDPERALATHGYTVFQIGSGGSRERVAAYRASLVDRLLTGFRLTRQGLRLGFHNLWPLADGSMVAIVKKTLLKKPAGSREFRVVGRLRWGNKPGLEGLCVDDQGLVYYGEYVQNMDRKLPIGLFRSDDGGESYRLIHEFPAAKVRHIHFVQWDPYERCLWMGTGDRNEECLLLRSEDRGVNWQLVGGGSQLWRAVGVVFTPESVFWGTDAGSDAGTTPNFIVRLDRSSRRATRVQEVQGPCHGNAALKDGTLLVTAGVEGGINEKDRSIHLWAGRDGQDWQEVAAWRKDRLPHIAQFGVAHFAHGIEQQNALHFTLRAVTSAPELYVRANLLS